MRPARSPPHFPCHTRSPGPPRRIRPAVLRLVAEEKPDVLAISEHKIAPAKLEAQSKELKALLPGHTAHWALCTVKNGYSGVVCLVRDGTPVSAAGSTAIEHALPSNA